MFRNRQSVLTQIALLRLQLNSMSSPLGLDSEDATKERNRLRRAPEAEVKELFAELKHEWTRDRKELL